MHAARSFSTGENVGGAGTSLAFGYVLLTAFFAGSQFAERSGTAAVRATARRPQPLTLANCLAELT
jgi:hypothetical protein